MSEPRIDFPEMAEKLFIELFVLEDPEFGRKVLVRFSDGIQLSIAIGVRQVVNARYYSEETPDLTSTHRESNSTQFQ